MPDPKPDNSTHEDIIALSDKFDSIVDNLKSDRDLPNVNAARIDSIKKTAGVVSAVVSVGLGWWMTVIWQGQGETNKNLVNLGDRVTQSIGELKDVVSKQGADMRVMAEKMNHQAEMKVQLEKIEAVNRMLEERLRMLERVVKP